MIFLKEKVGQSLDVDGWPSLLQFTQKKGLQQILFSCFWFPQLWQRDSRAVFGNMFKLLTVKTTNNRFLVLFTVGVFSKNIYLLC